MYIAHIWALSLQRKKNMISLWLTSHNPLFIPLIISMRCFTNSGDRNRTSSSFPMTKGINSPDCFGTQLRLRRGKWGGEEKQQLSCQAYCSHSLPAAQAKEVRVGKGADCSSLRRPYLQLGKLLEIIHLKWLHIDGGQNYREKRQVLHEVLRQFHQRMLGSPHLVHRRKVC